jgi:hydrogenase maturation protease
MRYAGAERLARALMFEGYVLYPYRRSSLKNMQRFSFGTLQQRARCAAGTSDSSALRVECLVRGAAPALELSVRFLQHVRRDDAGSAEPWIEAVERCCDHESIDLGALAGPVMPGVGSQSFEHAFPGEQSTADGCARRSAELCAQLTLATERLEPELFKLRIDVENTSDGEDALLGALGSVHVLLRVTGGRFVSLLEPPSGLAQHAGSCRSRGCFPVLVGPAERDDVMLASPIILYDRPAIAPESAGDFCDATEIDEMLTLRVLTLTDAERREAERTDEKSRAILERTFAQGDAVTLALHGARRSPDFAGPTLEPPSLARATDRAFEPGDAVLIRPRRGGDVFDLALTGERATVASIEEDFEGRLHYAVTVDADPGRDLGAQGMPGHRFFFSADELERIA